MSIYIFKKKLIDIVDLNSHFALTYKSMSFRYNFKSANIKIIVLIKTIIIKVVIVRNSYLEA